MPASPEYLAAERFVGAAHAAGMPLPQLVNFVRARVALQPKQCEASAIARSMDLTRGPEELGYGGARGGGKSHWMLAQMGADDCQRFPGVKCLLLRKVGKSLQEAFRDLLLKTLGFPSLLGYKFTSSSGELWFRNGSCIILGHFQNEGDIAKYLGLEYDIIGIEEATTLTKQKIEDIGSCNRSSKKFFDPLTGEEVPFRPRIYTTTNPGGVGHAYYKEHFVDPSVAGRETITRFLAATARDNSFNNPEYLGRLMRLTGWRRRAWLDGDWNISAGQFFTTFRPDFHVVKPEVAANALRHARRIWLAGDYGFTHYTVVYLFAEDGDGGLWVCAEHARRRWLVNRHCEALDEMLQRNGVQKRKLETIVFGGDVFSTRGEEETVADKYEAAGYPLTRAIMSRVSGWAECMDKLGDPDPDDPALMVQPRMWISSNCPRLVSCIPALQHDQNHPEDVKKVDTDEEGDGGDDPADAWRYGVMVSRSTGGAEMLDAGG